MSVTYNPLGNQYTQINTNVGSGVSSTASTASTATTASTASTSATNVDKNDASGLNSLLNLASQGTQIAGAIRYQRQQSGASARRQTLIGQCGRRPLFGRQAKADYDKCKANYEASLTQPQGGGQGGDGSKSLTQQQGSSMKFVWIGVGVLAIGTIAYLTLRKK